MAVPDVASPRAPRWWPVPEAATPRGGRYGMTLLVLAAVYFGAAKLGLTMAFVAEQVTAVWPPTGIALVAIVLFGYRVWPGIWLGAFLANATAHEPLLTAVGIAIGNTLEAVTGAWLLHRVAGFGKSLDRLQDALGLVVLAALGSTTVSATLGSAALVLGGLQPWSAFGRLWWVWWLGDAMGDLVMAPVLLTWATAGRRPPLFRLAEAGTLIASLVAVSLVVFAGRVTRITSSYPLEYVVFPFVMWAALRFGQLGTTTVTFVASAIAIWGTVNGFGPFAKGTTVHESLILLQIFMGVVAVSGLLLAAVMNERQIAARRRVVGYAVTQALAESGTLEEAAPRILRAIGESLEWNLGALWRVDEDANVLRCLDVWHGASGDFAEFAAVTRGGSFRRGSDLPGRVWASGAAAWIPDVVRDRSFPRAPVAVRARLHGAFGFAIVRGDRVLGVLEFFSREIQRPDGDLLELAAAIGSQIGQFIERRRSLAEQQRTERAFGERESAARRDAEQAHERAAFLAEASKRLASSLDYRATLASVAHLAIPLLADASCVDLIEENGRLSRVAVAGSEAAVSTEPPDVAPPPAVDGVLRSGKPAVSPPLGELRPEGGDVAPTSSMIVPLVVGGRTLGAVTFLLTRPGRRYGPADLALAEELARRAAAAIDHARLFRAAEAAQAEAEAANRAKDQYLSTLSHELRTPLNAIVGWAEVLRRHPDHATVARGMDTIARNAKAQARLIDDLLDISRIISGKLQLDMRPVDLVSVITAAVDAARPAADEKGLQLDSVLDAATGSVFGDAHRLQQVVANLLSNAIKFTPAPGRVEVHLRPDGAEAEIRVSDTGQGIPADFLPYVFERFRQADATTARAHAGLGLGLAIVRHLVELHGGRVKAESPGGGAGASFTVSLPLLLGGRPTSPSAPVGTTPLLDNEPTLDGVHVLLVDDEADAREVLTALLEERGARVTVAASAAEAVERLERVRPDILVSDLSMPDEDGYALIRRVRTLPGDRGGQIPAVALTAYAGVEDRERAFAAGFEVHVAKPVEGGELAAAIMAGLVSASSRAGRVRS